MQYFDVTAKFNEAVLVQAENDKLVQYVGSDSWPTELHTTKNNLLQPQSMDREIIENGSN